MSDVRDESSRQSHLCVTLSSMRFSLLPATLACLLLLLGPVLSLAPPFINKEAVLSHVISSYLDFTCRMLRLLLELD